MTFGFCPQGIHGLNYGMQATIYAKLQYIFCESITAFESFFYTRHESGDISAPVWRFCVIGLGLEHHENPCFHAVSVAQNIGPCQSRKA